MSRSSSCSRAILLAAVMWGVRRFRAHLTLPSWREAGLQAGIAAVVTAFLTLTLGGLSTYAWESLALEPQRLWRGAVYALMVLPFFFGMRSLLRAMAPRLRHPVLADLGASVLIIAALVGAIVMNFGRLSYLGILLPIVIILLLLFAAFSAVARRTLQHPVALVAVLEAFLLAWVISATLPLVACDLTPWPRPASSRGAVPPPTGEGSQIPREPRGAGARG